MRNKKGFVPVLFVIIVLAISSAVVFFVIRNNQKAKAATNNYPTPVGTMHISPTTFSNKSSSYFSASEVYGANGAAVDNVRYYIINPKLEQSNAWGNPDWCASGGTCDQNTQGIVTYNIGAPTNGGDFHVTWDANTKNAESTQYDRGLSPYLLPGLYQIGLRVQDVNGNVNGNTGPIWVTITDGTLASPVPSPIVTSCTYNPSVFYPASNLVVNRIGSGQITLNILYKNSVTGVVKNSQNLASSASPFTLGWYPPAIGEYYFEVNSVRCTPNRIVDPALISGGPTCFFTDSVGIRRGYGDVNNNRFVNASDSTLVKRSIAGLDSQLTGDAKKAADVNGDGAITTADSDLILQFYFKTITKFPVCK